MPFVSKPSNFPDIPAGVLQAIRDKHIKIRVMVFFIREVLIFVKLMPT